MKYLGLIDTVKALNDQNLHDILATTSVYRVRHALALFEKKTVMSPERFNVKSIIQSETEGQSIQEAWFAGTHGNLGGSCKQDGLALWPLHWLMTEAQAVGLVIGFKSIEQCDIPNPAKLIRIRSGDVQLQCTSYGGIQTLLSDFSATFRKEGYFPCVETGGKSFPSPQEFREVFQNGQLVGKTTSGI